MDKKLLSKLLLLSLSGALLAACGNEATDAPEEVDEPDTEEVETSENAGDEEATDEVTFSVDIVVEGEAVADLSKEITAPEGMYLLESMKDAYDLEEDGGFISEIEGYEQDADEGIYWLYYVNGESGEVGAADYAPEEADQIEWRLEGFE